MLESKQITVSFFVVDVYPELCFVTLDLADLRSKTFDYVTVQESMPEVSKIQDLCCPGFYLWYYEFSTQKNFRFI